MGTDNGLQQVDFGALLLLLSGIERESSDGGCMLTSEMHIYLPWIAGAMLGSSFLCVSLSFPGKTCLHSFKVSLMKFLFFL